MPRRGDCGRVNLDGARADRRVGGGRAAKDAAAGVVGQGRELLKPESTCWIWSFHVVSFHTQEFWIKKQRSCQRPRERQNFPE